MNPIRLIAAAALFVLPLFAGSSRAADPTSLALADRFTTTVQPFVQEYCVTCHGKEKPKGDVDLTPYSTMGKVVENNQQWETVLEKLKAQEMPPEKAKKHATAEQRAAVIEWITSMRRNEAQLHAGDPGIVLARRLSNAEYDYTIRDLTGVDIHPTKEFPVDPANEAGFDNTGESLTMSPSLVKKYLEAARHVSEYLVLKPDGLAFAPFPLIDETDRDKYCVRNIIQFYKSQPTDLTEYFLAAWHFQNRAALGKPQATLADIAAADKVSPKYLASIYAMLTTGGEEIGPIAGLQAMWKQLPADPTQDDAARTQCCTMRDTAMALREKVKPLIKLLSARPEHPGSQPLILWKDRQSASWRMTYGGGALDLKPEDLAPGTAAETALAIPTEADARVRYEDSFRRFCEVIPDAFVVTERAGEYLSAREIENEKRNNAGRLLSAGFHSQMGYFRDDMPLFELVLDQKGQQELDELWNELNFISDVPIRTYQGFLWFGRSDSSFIRDEYFDFARAEARESGSSENIAKLADGYVAKMQRFGAGGMAIAAAQDYFDRMNYDIRWVEQARLKAEPSHIRALQDFAQKAYRRPLSQKERDSIAGFYQALRKEDGLDHESAVRDTLVSILMSPFFSFRADPRPPEPGVQPLSDYQLASRLSYFLWSSMPDDQLLASAAKGELHRRDVLLAQARRMMADQKIRGMAIEFGGNWLDIRRFEELNSVDRERFPDFSNDLRDAMFEEPIRFVTDAIQSNRSTLDFLYGDYTFINPILAHHYGMPSPGGSNEHWVRIDHASEYQRGGLLPMAAFLTKNAPGLRTSPVKRGNWVVKRLLGERIPAPPPNVPVLPADESKLGDLTLREALAKHREDKSCASCHVRFDSIGLVFEGYGPTGERRTKDMGGRSVEISATFPDGSDGAGLDGLKDYLKRKRQDDFVDNLCRKLLSYALGRSLVLSDDPTVEQMRAKLAANDYRFGTLVESIITSPQFLNRRGQATIAQRND